MTQSERIEAVAKIVVKARSAHGSTWAYKTHDLAQSIDTLYAARIEELEGALEHVRVFFDRDFSIDGPNLIIPFASHAMAIRKLIAVRSAAALAKHKSPQEDEVQR